MKVSDHLTRAFYAVVGRDAEDILANTTLIKDDCGATRIEFSGKTSASTIYASPTTGPIALFHELAHAYHIHHWPVVSHSCAVERCEEAASCLTWMAAYVGVLSYSSVLTHDQAVRDPWQRVDLLTGQIVASKWRDRGYDRQEVNAVIRGVLHADLR